MPPPRVPEYTERFFRSGALRIHFRDWGDPAAPPLVIVHGLRDHSHSFDDLARGLLDRFHVLALDLRGHGACETTPYYAFGHFVLDLHNLVRALRLRRPILVGHSMGGEVVATYAGSFPDVPARLVLVEGLGPPPGRWTTRCVRPWRASRASTARSPATPGSPTSRPPTGACANATRGSRRRRRGSSRCSGRARARTAGSSGSSTRCW